MQNPVLTFASLVINGLGFTPYETILHTAPSGAVQMLLLWIGLALCYVFRRHRSFVVIIVSIPPLIGSPFLMILTADAGWSLIVTGWLASCTTAVMSILLSLSASHVKGNTKRSITNCMFFIGYCVGCIASPQLWTNKPRSFEGVVTAIVTWCLLIVAVAAYWYICHADNFKQNASQSVVHEAAEQLPVGRDMTDKEDRGFRYRY